MTPTPTLISFDGSRVRLEAASPEAVRSFFDQARAQEGFLLPLPSAPPLFAVLDLEVAWGDAFRFAFQARVIQVFDRPTAPPEGRHGVAFQLEGWSDGRSAELERELCEAESGAEAVEGGEGEAQGETLGTSPIFRIKAMKVAEKMRLAVKASRTERQILLRDTSPQVLMGLLSNPHLDSEEMLQIVRSTHATGGILQRVAGDRRWSQNAEIRAALARHPQTPAPVALRLLDTLRTPDLQVLARSSGVRETLRRAALKIYLGRLSSR